MRGVPAFLTIIVGVIACSDISAQTHYKIDTSRITVSGISSGGYMAGQLHIAHSHLFGGLAMLAAGPYRCSEGSLAQGLGPCLKGGDIDPAKLLLNANEMSNARQIDTLANLTDDRIWLFHGANDTVVGEGVVTAAAEFYKQLISTGQVVTVLDVAAVHGMPTLSVGAACDDMTTPFLNACNYDAAGELLKAMYGPMHERVTASGELRLFPQPNADNAKMLHSAFLYVPESCAGGDACGLHVALHGCQQSSAFIDDTFASGAGYNEWAESNNLLVLYPQVANSIMDPQNPLGCWDWWGYTNDKFATKTGVQVTAIKSMIDVLAGSEL